MIDFGLISVGAAIAIALALLFDFYNGVNDSANSIATVVATRALKPVFAVMLAATMNFAGAFLIGTAVAKTVGSGIVDPGIITTGLIVAALLGGIAWTALATKFGVPVSVSHALIGGLLGAAIAATGLAGVQMPGWEADVRPALEVMATGAVVGVAVATLVLTATRGKRWVTALTAGLVLGPALWLVGAIALAGFSLQKLLATVIFIAYSPILGFLLAYGFNVLVIRIAHRYPPSSTRRTFRILQLFSASFYSLGHGTNDAQKTMGVITALLLANGALTSFEVPWEVIVAAGTAIALGTFIGGYKVVRTMGHRLTQLEPSQGFSAETSSALGLFFLAGEGVPVSTTHSIAGSIMGVGATHGIRKVSWGVARYMMGAWLVTIPAAAAVAAISFWAIRAGGFA